MQYHPLIGIIIFILAIIFSFILGRSYFNKKSKIFAGKNFKKNTSLPKGEITSPDAPWLDKN